MNQGVAVQDEHGIAIYVNPKFCEILGYSRSEILGHRLTDCMDTANRRLWKELMDQRDPGERHTRELRLARRDGTTIDLIASSQALVNEEGQFTGRFATLVDVTEHKQVEEHARQHQVELARAAGFNVMREMLSNLACELNQALTAISTYSEISLQTVRSGEQRSEHFVRAMEGVSSQARRTGELVHRITNLVLKCSPRGGALKTCIDINALVREAVGPIAAEADGRLIAVRLKLEDNLPRVSVDPVQIEQVLLNLMQNSIEAMTTLEIKERELTVRTQSYGKDAIQVTIKDTGPGLDTQMIDRTFDPFYTTKPDALGMGLPVSRSIIDSHGGKLWVEPAAQHTTFHFTLPVTVQ